MLVLFTLVLFGACHLSLVSCLSLVDRWPDDGKICRVYAKNFTAAEGFVVDSSDDILDAVSSCGDGGTIVLGSPG